jgi:DNA polymerase beta
MPSPSIDRKRSFFISNQLLHGWFTRQIAITTANRTKTSGFRLKVYRNIIHAIDQFNGRLVDTNQTLVVLRKNGMKFTGEDNYHKKHGVWKSSVLNQIDYMLTHGKFPESKEIVVDPKTTTIQELTTIPEIGASAASKLYDLGICSIQDLLTRTDLLNRKQKLGLRYHRDLAKRIPREEMDKWNDLVIELAEKLKIRLEIVGSYRRGVESSGDIDIMISDTNPQSMEILIQLLVDKGYILDEFVHGKKKFGGVAKIDKVCRKLDIACYPPEQYPYALLHWTGSGDFNQIIRAFAKKKGMTLCEYGLYRVDGKEKISIPDEMECGVFDEKDIFRYLGVEYIEPKDRTNKIKLG